MTCTVLTTPQPTGLATKQKRKKGGLRTRTSIVLLTALLLMVVVISGLTIKLLNGQRALLDDTIRESQAQTMALLGNRVEQTLLAAMRPPFLALKNIPPAQVNAARFAQLRQASPEVEQLLFLSAAMSLKNSFPAPRNANERHVALWLAQRAALDGVNARKNRYVLHTFMETLDGRPALFALQRVSEIDQGAGWILIRFNLDVMTQRLVTPLLTEFSTKLGGPVQLQDADASWDDDALNWPAGRVLPGWLLVFKASDQVEARTMRKESALMWGVAAAVILTMVMAMFAVWRELRREHALVDLRNRFVANVSHELKTPLALIRMYAETLYLRRITGEQRQHEYHRVLLHEAERLSQMINTVLDFSRLSRGGVLYHLTQTDLRGSVSDILGSYRWRVEEQGLRLEIALGKEIPPILHDRNGVTQMLLNLIDNAVKYAAVGGVVRVILSVVADAVELQVIDLGPGIPPQERDRIRKPFERGEREDPANGSGLGLALVDQIAKIHHAQFILATPQSGTGVAAVVRFPIHEARS